MPPVMLSRTPRGALHADMSSSGLEMAMRAASWARVSPVPRPIAIKRAARIGHDRLDVGEVEIDQAWLGDQLADALDALAQHVVDFHERLLERCLAIDHFQQPIVGNGDQRVDSLAQLRDAFFGILGPLPTLEAERLGHHADGQRTELFGRSGR